jgi:hypothetical protein
MNTKYIINILLNGVPIFDGYFIVSSSAPLTIIEFYEYGNPFNILAPPGSFGSNDNLFISINQPFSSSGVNITTMSYYASNPNPYGSNNNPPSSGGGTYNLYDFINNQGNITNFSQNTYNYIITLELSIPSSLPADNSCQKSRFCYNYKPPGVIEPCCTPIVCASSTYLSSLQTIPNVVNNSSRTIESSLLQASQQQMFQINQANQQQRTLQSTLTNTALITEQLMNQLADLRNQRYVPYKPYVYPETPQSVIELQMRTANVGVPMPVFTMADCKGSQFVTT